MRLISFLFIILIISQSTTQVAADNNLIKVGKGTYLEYEVKLNSLRSNGSTIKYNEYYELKRFDDRLFGSDATDHAGQVASKKAFDTFFLDIDNYLYFNYTGIAEDIGITFYSENAPVSPFYPGGVIVVRDWDYFLDFGSIYRYSLIDDYSVLVESEYEFLQEEDTIQIDMFSIEDQFHGDSKYNYTIRNIESHNMVYERQTGILVHLIMKDLRYNLTNVVMHSPDGSISISIRSQALREDHYTKSLIKYQLYSPNTDSNLFSFTLEQIIAYSLLITIVAVVAYLDFKKLDYSWNTGFN